MANNEVDYVSYNNYYGHECEWHNTTYDTYITIAPKIYSKHSYSVYATENFTDTLTEPSGSTGSWSGSKYVSLSNGGYALLDTFSQRTYQRKASDYTITLVFTYSGGSSWSGSYHSVSSSATFTLTVPHLDSYTVTYNGNGGGDTVTNVPSQQTKYKGSSLALSSQEPVRIGYDFKGWNTAADGSGTSYAKGANYTANANLTLYAQWTLAILPPTVYFNAYRVETASSTIEAADGEYAYGIAEWEKGDNAVTSIQYRYRIDDGVWGPANSGNGWTDAVWSSGSSGTATTSGAIALPTSSYMEIQLKATDGTVSTIVSSTIPNVNFPIEFYDRDKTLIHDLYLADLTSRGNEESHSGTITKVYSNNGFTLEVTTFWYSSELVTIPIKFVASTAFAGNGSTTAASIPEEFAPPVTVLFPLFATDNGWGSYIIGCGIMSTDGTIKFWSKSANVWFGSVTYVRKPSGWTSS